MLVKLRAPIMALLILLLAMAQPAAGQESGADLVITASDGGLAVEPGDTLTYTIVVGNEGPDAAENVKVLNAVPDGTLFLGADATSGGCDETGGIVMCDLGTIESGAAVRILVSMLIGDIPASTVENTFVASSTTSDPDPANNSAEETSSTLEVLPLTGAVDQVILPMAALAIAVGAYLVVWARRSRGAYLLRRIHR